MLVLTKDGIWCLIVHDGLSLLEELPLGRVACQVCVCLVGEGSL